MAKMTGKKKAQDRIRSLSGRDRIDLVGRALFAGGQAIRAEARRSITANSQSGKNHRPSAPGTPPSNDTGFLADSIVVSQIAPLRVRISATAPYAAIHEFGGTINHPGGTAFFIRDGGEAVFVSNEAAARFASIHGRELPRTKPHPIVMPARPYMAPAARAKRTEVVALVRSAVKTGTVTVGLEF